MSQGPKERSAKLGILLPLLSLLVASLACTRSDVSVTQSLPEVEAAELSPTSPLLPSSEPNPTEPPVTSTPTATLAVPEAPSSPTPPPTPTPGNGGEPETIVYEVQTGETLRALAIRFAVVPEEIEVADGVRPGDTELLAPDRLLLIPRRLGPTGPSDKLIPDSEFVYSPHAVDFDPISFARDQGGFLIEYRETVYGRWRSGPEVVELAARDNSVNPRLLLAMLEYLSGWVTDPERPSGDDFTYPLGYEKQEAMGLYRQLTWLANEMGVGYYAWRAGTLTEITLEDGSVVRLHPELNAGTVALQRFLGSQHASREWAETVSLEGWVTVYETFFGDPWQYRHPLFEPSVQQPPMTLPFLPGHTWSFTGGPHGAWEREAAWAALDFAPSSVESGCARSEEWVVASAPGLVLRSGGGLVVLDLDGDGREQTGWVLIYLHIAEEDSVQVGDFVEQDDLIGHPSCEGGIATGTHLHIARKYNGEWILADGPLPFEMDGWVARAGSLPYQGALVNGDQTVLACPCASQETLITR